MKNLNLSSLTKSFKSVLIKLAKALKIRPTVLYAILGLIVVILLALGLGQKKEGFSSMVEAKKSQDKIISDMLKAINGATWTTTADKTTFMQSVDSFFKKKMRFLTQGDITINTFDLGSPAGATIPDGKVFVSNNFPQPMYDASTNKALPLYVDNTPNAAIDLRKYTLESTIANPVKQLDLDALSSLINTQISKLSGPNQITLNAAFAALSKSADDMAAFMKTEYSATTFDDILMQDDDGVYDGYESDGPDYDSPDYTTFGYGTSGSTGGYGTSGGYGLMGPIGLTGPMGLRGPAGPMGLTGPMGPMGLRGPAGKDGVTTVKTISAAAGTSANNINSTGTPLTPAPVSSNAAATATASSPTSPWGNAGAGSVGITQANIPPGSQDLYMLKTQVTPPSNPPGSSTSPNPNGNDNPSPTQTCGCKPAPVQPCPPCERCPEPAFDCKRVPNYNSTSINQYLPQPVLADFSQFGM